MIRPTRSQPLSSDSLSHIHGYSSNSSKNLKASPIRCLSATQKKNKHTVKLNEEVKQYHIQQPDLLQTIRLFISEWDGRYDWLQTAEHDIVWSMWAIWR